MTAARPEPLILTAWLDSASQERFDRERQRHFPSKINFIPAHVTLFHHLPGAQAEAIMHGLAAACQAQPPEPFSVTGLRHLGRGNAYALAMPGVSRLRARLAAEWQAAEWQEGLTAQDRQPWQPHVTVQNKVSPAEAKQLQAVLQQGFVPQEGFVTGLLLWRYLGGPWERAGGWRFAGHSA